MEARSRAALAILVTVAAATVAASARSEEVTAVVTQLRGEVTVAAAPPRGSRGPLPDPLRVRFLQIVRVGDEVHLPDGAGAGFVCSTDRWVEVSGGRNQKLTADLCRSGKLLPPGTYRKLAPGAGRLRSLESVYVLEGETRGGEEDFAVPIVVSPRHTAILDSRPTLLWTPVSGATDYEIELTGPKPFSLPLDASVVKCTETWGDLTVCKLDYPAAGPDLPAGTTSFLRVRARRGIAAPPREEAKPSRIERLPADKAEKIRIQLQRVEDLPVNEQTRDLLAADVYAQADLLADAISAYRKALAIGDVPEARVTLGNALLKIGLLRPAAKTYQETLGRNPGTAVKAAAEFGLGRVEYDRNSFEHAEGHFKKARELYLSLGLKEEAKKAEEWVGEAEQKRPR
ncbi:MAG TPA: tetratricopeptide repeat protein [Thermoanaerobaculia bacterium]|nr:tetratricopeptide repeat protein [Thermoanaerobaculia bacterium]